MVVGKTGLSETDRGVRPLGPDLDPVLSAQAGRLQRRTGKQHGVTVLARISGPNDRSTPTYESRSCGVTANRAPGDVNH